MSWPTTAEVADALRHPLRCFSDVELRRAQAVVSPEGMTRSRSGELAEVFEVRNPGSFDRWAIKFYRRDLPGLDRHYRALAELLLSVDVSWLTAIQYQERGVCVRGRWYPALKMRWFDGIPLHTFIEENADQPLVLRRLLGQWVQVSRELSGIGLAHGGLQHEHVLVRPARVAEDFPLQLIDYDGMFFAARAGEEPLELGHPAYEHPQRSWQRTYDAQIDRFPQLVIYGSLLAAAAGGSDLWQRYHDGNNLLFRESDFQEPGNSALFRELWRSPLEPVRTMAARLLLAALGKPGEVPSLQELETQANTHLATDPCDLPQLLLSAEERDQVEAILGDAAGESGSRKTFDLQMELEPANTGMGGEFDLIVDDEPAEHAIAAGPPPLPALGVADPPPLPVVAIQPVEPPPPLDPRARVYKIQAWMPEQVAVMKVRGFVDAWTGEIVASEPGIMRVRLLNPYELVNPQNQGLMSWLGFVHEPAQQPRSLAALEFHMQYSETEHQKLLDITLLILPSDGSPEGTLWRTYCDKLFCEVRGFLMGNR